MSNGSRKRLAVFLDGTWNEPGDNTNVWRTKIMVAEHGLDGIPQLAYYDEGVGTHWLDRFRGGVLGKGLSRNVRQAYQWLIEHYNDDDEVFVFGFSRGAYTARSLVGMIAKCGLLQPGAPMPVIQVFERYCCCKKPKPLYVLQYEKRHGREDFTFEEEWLLHYSCRIPIKFIGIWDTVGALGIPIGRIPGLSRRTFYFHHTRLSNIIEHAYQAQAIDEHRKPFSPSLWTEFTPKDDPASGGCPVHHIEQRWFIGAHSNIGGGYRNDPLAQIPFAWILKKAASAGLGFRQTVTLFGKENLAPVADSFAQFMMGIYRILRLWRRYYRTIGWPRQEKDKGWIDTVNETIDKTVFKRWQMDPDYRPRNLKVWAEKTNQDLDTLKGSVSASDAAAVEIHDVE